MWIIEPKVGDIIIIPTFWDTDDDKDFAALALKELMKSCDAQRYAFVTEAWILNATKRQDVEDAYKKYDSLEHHPDRREVLMITAEDRKETIMRTYYILRPEHAKATLSPAEDMNNPDKQEGRFANLLPKDAQD